MQCSSMRAAAPCHTRRAVLSNHLTASNLKHRTVLRSFVPYHTENPLPQDAQPSFRPISGLAGLVAGAAVAWALVRTDSAQAADSSGRISGSTFASRRTAVQANGYDSGSVAPTASFTRNSSNTNVNTNATNVNTTNVNHSTTNVNHSTTNVNHTTTHVNHTTVVVAPPAPIIPIPVPVMAPVVPVAVPVVAAPVVAEPVVVAAAPAPAPTVVVSQGPSVVTTVLGLLAVILLLYIIAQVMSAFSGSSSSRYS